MGGEQAALRRAARGGRWVLALGLVPWVLGVGPVEDLASAPEKDSCVACHGDPGFLVTDKKLYDYFQQWATSIHRQEGVSCDDCHGGNAEAAEKEIAHGAGVGASDASSGVHFKNLADTCGQCHEDILEGFHESDHFQHVEKKGEGKQGPTCATCHGSISAEILNVNSVEAACARCHSEKTANHPDIPAKARQVLNKFLSIHRLYRYVATHAEPDEAKQFFGDLDARLERLSVTWHTFDLEKIDAGTAEAVDLLKAKRDEIRRRRAEARARAEAEAKAGAE